MLSFRSTRSRRTLAGWRGSLILAVVCAGSAVAPAAAQSSDEFPASFYFETDPTSPKRMAHRELEGKPYPAISLKQWIGKEVSTAEFKGKVVVIDFWATWCGPCRRAIPHNNEMIRSLADKGLVIIGIHDSARGWDSAAQVVRDTPIDYPVALDESGRSASAWRVQFWPTYGVIDRKGTLRALGITPDAVEPVVLKLLGESGLDKGKDKDKDKDAKHDDSTVGSQAIPESWLEGAQTARKKFDAMLKRSTPPALAASKWLNDSDPVSLSDLNGKVVLLLFCTPERESSAKTIREINDLYQKRHDDGLEVIGVVFGASGKQAEQTIKKLDVAFPVFVDDGRKTVDAYKVDNAPDCYLIDREGKLRIADCKESFAGEAVALLLKEGQEKPKDGSKDTKEAKKAK